MQAIATDDHASRAFNRTSMELKRYYRRQFYEVCQTFNRTSMELKLQRLPLSNLLLYTFNRTSMELKLLPIWVPLPMVLF